MVLRVLPVRARNGRSDSAPKKHGSVNRFFAQLTSAAVVAVFGTFFSISSASIPSLHADQQVDITSTFASLSYAGSDPVVTGSLNQLFKSSSFIGPTSAQKMDRLRPQVDVAAFADSFLAERVRIASLQNKPVDPADPPQSHISISPVSPNIDEAPRISLAAIDPALASAALAAIEKATPLDPSIPLPIIASDQLAYSRANTPTTEHAANPYSERERWCLATGIYFEARGEAYRGQVAVAQVIMNRVKHSVYPNSICGVVFQNQSWRNRCQFSFACDGIPERVTEPKAWAQAREITEKVTTGSLYLAEVANATHYHANYVYPHWAPRMTKLTRIGAHIFYRFRRS